MGRVAAVTCKAVWDLALPVRLTQNLRACRCFYRKETLLYLAAVVLITWTGIGVAQQDKVPAELLQKAQTQGVVRVIVGLNVPWQPEGKLTKDAALAQRKAIAAAQDELLAELTGTKYRVTGRYRFTPGMGLEVGPDALKVLELSAGVTEVREDRVAKPSVEHSGPKKTP